MSAWHRYVFQEDDTSMPTPQKSSETGFASSSSVAGADADVAADGVDPRRRRVGPPVARRASTGSLRPVPGALYAGPPGGHLRHAAGPAPGGHLAADDAAVGDPGRGTESLQDAPRASPNCSTRARRSLFRTSASRPRRGRDASEKYPRPRPRRRRDSSPRTVHVPGRGRDSSPRTIHVLGRGVATILRRNIRVPGRGVAATPSPRTLDAAAAASPRLVSTDCPRPRPREKYPARRSGRPRRSPTTPPANLAAMQRATMLPAPQEPIRMARGNNGSSPRKGGPRPPAREPAAGRVRLEMSPKCRRDVQEHARLRRGAQGNLAP